MGVGTSFSQIPEENVQEAYRLQSRWACCSRPGMCAVIYKTAPQPRDSLKENPNPFRNIITGMVMLQNH